MNRKKTNLGDFQSLISTSKDLYNTRVAAIPGSTLLNTARFRGKLAAAIATISAITVCFLSIPNSIMYLMDSKHGTRCVVVEPAQSSPRESRTDYEYAYIHAGIALIILGCLAMVVSIVLSHFALKRKRKMDNSEGRHHMYPEVTKSSRIVPVAIIMMNIDLFMAIIKGCMEILIDLWSLTLRGGITSSVPLQC